jgi:hypothetical protein
MLRFHGIEINKKNGRILQANRRLVPEQASFLRALAVALHAAGGRAIGLMSA